MYNSLSVFFVCRLPIANLIRFPPIEEERFIANFNTPYAAIFMIGNIAKSSTKIFH